MCGQGQDKPLWSHSANTEMLYILSDAETDFTPGKEGGPE